MQIFYQLSIFGTVHFFLYQSIPLDIGWSQLNFCFFLIRLALPVKKASKVRKIPPILSIIHHLVVNIWLKLNFFSSLYRNRMWLPSLQMSHRHHVERLSLLGKGQATCQFLQKPWRPLLQPLPQSKVQNVIKWGYVTCSI